MAVRKLKSGEWVADVTVGVKWDGSRDRRVEPCQTKGQARKAQTRLLMEKERLRGRVTARITLAEFVDEVYWPQKAGLHANTRQGYERDLRRRILLALGNMEIEQINKLDVRRMLSARPTRKTSTNARETLSSVLGCAVEMGMLLVNPASFRYTYPGGGAADPERGGEGLSTFGDHERLLGYLRKTRPGSCVERIRVIGLCEGLRKGEVLALR